MADGGGNISLQSSPSDNKGGFNINRQLRQAKLSTGPEYYNPNPFIRLLGRANKSEIEIDGKISKALRDSGAMILMTKEYCDEHGYEIQPLDQLVLIEGSGGTDVPYLDYIEVRMQILGISSYDQDVLMLISHTTTHYHKSIPLQVGSQIIDQVANNKTKDKLKTLSHSWKLAYLSTVLSKSSQISDQEFNLDHVKGKLVLTKKVVIPTFQMVIVKGLIKVTGHQKCVHVLVEPSPKYKNIFVPGNTSELIPGASGVVVVVQKLSGRDIILEPHTEVGMITAANIVSISTILQITDIQDGEENGKVQCMSAQADLPEGETRQEETDPEDIFQKIDSSGITDLESTVQQEACNLICEYACISLQNDLDLGKTVIVKHSIKVTDAKPFKEHYRCIPPGIYEEVKTHIQEMLDVGAI